jgi:hypothetical protein
LFVVGINAYCDNKNKNEDEDINENWQQADTERPAQERIKFEGLVSVKLKSFLNSKQTRGMQKYVLLKSVVYSKKTRGMQNGSLLKSVVHSKQIRGMQNCIFVNRLIQA